MMSLGDYSKTEDFDPMLPKKKKAMSIYKFLYIHGNTVFAY